MERIFELLETHERMIRQGQIPAQTADSLLSSLQMLLGQIINNERRRLKQEEKLASRLHNLQSSVFEQVYMHVCITWNLVCEQVLMSFMYVCMYTNSSHHRFQADASRQEHIHAYIQTCT